MIEIVRDHPRLAALAPAWNDLADAMGNPLLRHDWIAASAQSFFSQDQLHLVVLRDGDALRAAAPLVRVPQGAGPELFAIGHFNLYEPTDFLYRAPADLEPLVAAVADLRLPVNLYRVPAGGAVASAGAWRRAALWAGTVASRPTASPYLDIRSDWDAFEAGLASKTRNDLSRARRRAERLGALDFAVLPADEETVADLFTLFLAVEERSWKQENQSAITSRRRLYSFFERFTRHAAATGGLHFAFMRLDERIVAAQFFQVRYDRLWIYKVNFDAEVAAVSPGNLLTREVVKFAFDSGLQGIEFLGSVEPWLGKWTSGVHDQADLTYYPPTAAGLGKRLYDRWPPARRAAGVLRAARDRARRLRR